MILGAVEKTDDRLMENTERDNYGQGGSDSRLRIEVCEGAAHLRRGGKSSRTASAQRPRAGLGVWSTPIIPARWES
jgi:hypothetical protein